MRRTLFVVLLSAMTMMAGCGSSETGGNQSAITIGNPQFTDVTQEAGLGDYLHETGGFDKKLMPEIVGPGGAFIDYNSDGWEDILLVVGGTFPHHTRRKVQAIRLYENNKDGTFTEVTYDSGIKDTYTYGFGVTVGDYDNDGDDDFFLSSLWKNMLFRNDNGVFENVSESSGLANEQVWSTSAMFFDADRDGWLDLYVGSYVDWTFKTDIDVIIR